MPGIRKVPLQNSLDEYRVFLTTLGAVMRRWRNIRHLSRGGLASMVGCSRMFITLVETGKRGVGLEMAWMIAQALNIPVDTFVPMLRVKNASKKAVRRKAAKIPLRSELVRERAEAAQRKARAA